MKQLFITLLLIVTVAVTATAKTQPEVIFSQEVIAINTDGSRLPSVEINPENMPGVQTHDFDLGRNRLLRIETNITNAEQRGLAEVVAVVQRCYDYIEATTGQRLNRGTMLYMIELDEIPYAYSFQASYDSSSQWSEVRLILLGRDKPLSGPDAPASLTDLLYDTLPHELGHDVLSNLPQLAHDTDVDISHHTRWFIEGVCETLAKGFSRREAPSLYRHFISLRKIDTVLTETQMHTDMLTWAQNNDNDMILESDLYGAAMLTMMAWAETSSIISLLEQIKANTNEVQGNDLIVMMQETTGIGPKEMIRRAHAHGNKLNKTTVLAQLD